MNFISALGLVVILLLWVIIFIYKLNKTLSHKLQIITDLFKKKTIVDSSDTDLSDSKILNVNEDNSVNKDSFFFRKEIAELIQIIQKKENEIKVLNNLFQDYTLKNPSLKKGLEPINNLISNMFSKNNGWVFIKLKIEKLHPQFFKKLYDKYPQLNQKEIQHCGYIVLNLTSVQVAEATFVSPKAVESARYRIKKKLGLKNDDNLIEHIHNLIV